MVGKIGAHLTLPRKFKTNQREIPRDNFPPISQPSEKIKSKFPFPWKFAKENRAQYIF
jgi:hypothetical protein